MEVKMMDVQEHLATAVHLSDIPDRWRMCSCVLCSCGWFGHIVRSKWASDRDLRINENFDTQYNQLGADLGQE